MEPAAIDVHAVTPDRWPDLVDLFERPGPRGGRPPTAWCWCMWWRDRSHDIPKNRAAMCEIVGAGREPGLLAYLDGVPVGWIAVAPEPSTGSCSAPPTLKPADAEEQGVFAVVCFYVHPTAKRRGVARRLVGAAAGHAHSRGATALEAYPADHLGGTSSTDFMGVRQWFLDQGFTAVRRAGSKTVVRVEFPLRNDDEAPS